jgi:glutaredoxin 3
MIPPSSVKIQLYIKPYCAWCDYATSWLGEHGIQYETFDVISNRAAYNEMVRISGQTLAPVIDVDGQVLADFGPDELAKFWQQIQGTNNKKKI